MVTMILHLILFAAFAIGAAVWTLIVVLANGMSDAPGSGFSGLGTVIAAWIAVAVIGILLFT